MVFKSESDHPFASFLKEGFRHVFVVVEYEGFWSVIDPGPNVTEVYATGADPIEYYKERFIVVEVDPSKMGKERPLFVISSCVGMAKAVLGIRCWAITPWQLYGYLMK